MAHGALELDDLRSARAFRALDGGGDAAGAVVLDLVTVVGELLYRVLDVRQVLVAATAFDFGRNGDTLEAG